MRHPYLRDTACIHRLVEEYKKYGKIVVAYDFDNTIFDFHSKGHDYSEVIELLKLSKAMGFYMIVFTAELNIGAVKEFLDTYEIPYDAVNENPPFFKSESRKIYFNILLDDRAGLSAAYHQLKETIHIIQNKLQ